MSDYKIQNMSYSIASNNYDKYAKAVAKASSLADVKVHDYVNINQKANRDVGGVETSIKSPNNILYDSDKIEVKQQDKSKGFFALIQAQLNKIARAEKSVDQETNLIELSESIQDADIALNLVIEMRNKIVKGWEEIKNMSF